MWFKKLVRILEADSPRHDLLKVKLCGTVSAKRERE
jgi:hypothetical protein